jgi:hypothetical protein
VLDQLSLSTDRRTALRPAPPRNPAPSDALKSELLALNRSDLEPTALRKAKRALIEGRKNAP